MREKDVPKKEGNSLQTRTRRVCPELSQEAGTLGQFATLHCGEL